jgi:O-antigen/teichoic acid export membrane protein
MPRGSEAAGGATEVDRAWATEHPPTPASIVEDDAIEAAVEPVEDRIALEGRTLREHTARGAIINSLFQIGLGVVGLVQRVAVAGFLTISEYGLWGLLVTTLITLAWLKQIGIADKFVQQDEADQEAAFQKAFTLELAYSAIFFVIACLAFPVYGAIYGHPEIVIPGIVLAFSLVLTALESPIWIAYRQMRFVRQRVLESIDPLVAATLTIALAIAGFGYWSLVIGPVAGSLCGGVAAIVTSPYPLRLRYDRGTLREYFSFSWPLLAASASGLVVVQGSVLIGNFTVGLAGLGAIGLASTFSMFADRLDALIRRTIYPAVCAVKDRTPQLFEAFTKSNRLALMWAFPFGVGLALFAPDLISFVLGERWREAELLLQVFGLTIAVRQVAFNWVIFFTARAETKPLAVSSAIQMVVFLAVTAPLMIAFGLDGYAAGMAFGVCVDLVVRSYFLSRLFVGFDLGRHLFRSVLPSVPPAIAILAIHAASSAERTLGMALGELVIYVVLTVLSTIAFERSLLTEMIGYVRRGVRAAPAPG